MPLVVKPTSILGKPRTSQTANQSPLKCDSTTSEDQTGI